MPALGVRGVPSPTAGRKAVTLTDPYSGIGKHVYSGQRWLCIVKQHSDAPLLISAWHTKEQATLQMERIARDMERSVERWQAMNKQRHIYPNLSPIPPYGRPDLYYVVEGEV
jgi:hypothetical protein